MNLQLGMLIIRGHTAEQLPFLIPKVRCQVTPVCFHTSHKHYIMKLSQLLVFNGDHWMNGGIGILTTRMDTYH